MTQSGNAVIAIGAGAGEISVANDKDAKLIGTALTLDSTNVTGYVSVTNNAGIYALKLTQAGNGVANISGDTGITVGTSGVLSGTTMALSTAAKADTNTAGINALKVTQTGTGVVTVSGTDGIAVKVVKPIIFANENIRIELREGFDKGFLRRIIEVLINDK